MFGQPEPDVLVDQGGGIPYELWPKYGLRLPKKARARKPQREQYQPPVIEPSYGLLAGESHGNSTAEIELIGWVIIAGTSAGTSKGRSKLVGIVECAGTSDGESFAQAEVAGIGMIEARHVEPITPEEAIIAFIMLD